MAKDWFDDTVQLEDPHPGPGWRPSPEQIKKWCARIRQDWPKAEDSMARRVYVCEPETEDT